MMNLLPLLATSVLLLLRSLAPTLATSIACHDFLFNVSTASFNDTGVIQPAASYSISATHCRPSKPVHHRASTVQLLLHGGTLNKFYWSALAPVGSGQQYEPSNYSYVDFARAEGYHTIAIDRLGAGNSSHPDPLLVRAGLQAELTNTIIEQIRGHRCSTPPPPLPRPFDKLILVSHSYGGFIANIMLNKHPDAVDATIMTGYVHVFSAAADSAQMQDTAPGRTVFPSRFGSLDLGYETLANATAQRESFYGADGTFDPALAAAQYRLEDVQAVGEAKSIGAELRGSFATEKSRFAGPLAVMMGAEDEQFCHGECGAGGSSGVLAVSKQFWPDAGPYAGWALENTGHLLANHYSAGRGFGLLHRWLETAGF